MRVLALLSAIFLCVNPLLSLNIISSLLWIEHTPQPYAIENFYNGSTPAALISGNISDLASDGTIDLAAGAEMPGLKQYANHRNLRLVYVICEVAYRIVADRRKGIAKLEDLRGKRIGTFNDSSASVFVHNMMSSVGIRDDEYEAVNGFWCMKTPCDNTSLSQMLADGQVDAFGLWEVTPEIGLRTLGEDAIVFQNASTYREVYSLYSKTEVLENQRKREDVVEYVRALEKTLHLYRNETENKGIYAYVAKKVEADEDVVESVWKHHKWVGRWDDGLIDVLEEEDKYLAGQGNRTATPRKELEMFLDSSVVDNL